MKIGILTFHCANNYGAVLQCYALQEYVKALGHDVYVIDYRPEYLVRRYRVFSIHYWLSKNPILCIKKLITEPYLLIVRNKRYRRLNNFINNNIKLCSYSHTKNNNDFDAIILGSDQIWNPNFTGKSFDKTYFGVDYNCKKIAYAASNRSTSLSISEEKFYKNQLKQLHHISVREYRLQTLLQPLTEKTVFLTLDPTLLSGINWTTTFNLKRPIQQNFIMLYEVKRHIRSREIAKAFAENLNSKFIELTGALSLSYRRIRNLDQTASPEKFLSYIKYSDFIFTTSFHGVALSILFKKDFYYITQHTDADERIVSLLKQLGIQDRMIEADNVPPYSAINYEYVLKKMSLLQESSVSFLKKALYD